MSRFLDFTRNPKPRRRPRPTRPAESRPTPRPRRCSVCGGQDGEHDWEVHYAEMRAGERAYYDGQA